MLFRSVKASDALVARDKNAIAYTENYSGQSQEQIKISGKSEKMKESGLKTLYDAIIDGDRTTAGEMAREALISGKSPKEIIDQEMIPAIQKVGERYEQKQYFLPQLIRGAEAMEKAMTVLAPELEKHRNERIESKGTIVIATVKGDVHDIGKNILAMLLKNYGFDVIDLGKDEIGRASCRERV